ncbi:MAG: leucyl/phenylalanyl-tRNA--protein transferase [Epsilonproteobacteria bacterium]|nr:leucyl/phenylalanyl-tRNA--protein transferase [Campylobacterota bacterium]
MQNPDTIYIPKLSSSSYNFPNPRIADKKGLLAWGGDLKKQRVLNAYMQGIFPWYNLEDPILWWSPDPRLVLKTVDIKVSKSLKRSIRKFEIKFDTNFDKVIKSCRNTRVQNKEDSWISDDLINLFNSLHIEHFAHSVETYFKGELVGGLYGLYLGGMFCGESMFSTKSDASKVALVALCKKIDELGGDFIDCQIPTSHLISMGAKEIKRDKFLDKVQKSLQTKSYFGKWS